MKTLIIIAAIILTGVIIYKKYKKCKTRNKNLKDKDYTFSNFL